MIMRRAMLCITASVSVLLWTSAVLAQQSSDATAPNAQSAGLEEIIVSARKREESLLKVPVVETAIPRAELERLQVTEMADLPTIVPGLEMGGNILTIGTQVAIRGIGSTAYDQGVDSSVSLNIDGLSLGNGLAFTSGLFDLAQVEVLKGPQALFYGKAASAGVISLRTADPTDEFEIVGRSEYEFESINPRGEFIISGPVTDTLKLRFAGQYSHSEGYFFNEATADPGTGAINPAYHRAPHDESYMTRITALWDPSSQFTARLKLNYDQDEATDASPLQLTDCPDGTGSVPPLNIPFIGSGENCSLDRRFTTVANNPANFPGIANNGYPYLDLYQEYGTLELNYRPTSNMTVTSMSGYYHETAPASVNAISTGYAGTPIVASNHQKRYDFTEEVRLNSEFSSPVNFTFGGLYEKGQLAQNVLVLGNSALGFPGLLQNGLDTVGIRTNSVFGQVRWQILKKLELAAGDRWSDETRTQDPIDVITGLPVPTDTPRIHSDTNSPEITLTYTATDDLTYFASYKKGFKSGSFSVGTPVLPGLDNSFGDERVHGEEAGLKSRLFDRQLALNVAAYYYDYSGLQVGAVQPPIDGTIVTRTVNAGEARTYGIDADAAFRPQAIQSLQLNGALNWNRAKYVELNNVPCWGGQTIADGCNQNFSPATGLYTAQNLSGQQLVRAPEWQINFGLSYTYVLPNAYQLIFSDNNAYTSRFPTILAIGRPNNDNYQGSYAKSDLGLTLKSPDNRWEVALIGKNITDRITSGNCTLSNIANGDVLGGEITGGTARGPAGIDEALCWADVGREIWLRLTVRPLAH
jgi:iron complex outermembrane recepter protein